MDGVVLKSKEEVFIYLTFVFKTECICEEAVRKIIEFGYESISRGLDKITVFTFYLPSIYRRISRKDELILFQKMEIMVYLLEISLKKMEIGSNIRFLFLFFFEITKNSSALLSDGFPLVLSVCDSFDSIKECALVAADKFYIVTSGYALLTELNNVFSYIKNHFDVKVSKHGNAAK